MKTLDFERSFVFVRTGDKVLDNILEKLELELRKLYQMNDQRIKQLSGGTGGGVDLTALMLKAIYDTNGNGVVDNAEKLAGLTLDEILAQCGGGAGDMTKAVYDINNNGVVDNAEKIDGRKIYVMNRAPQSGEGADGDIWIQYQE